MATADSVKTKLQALITKANNTTGASAADLSTAVDTLIAGFGSGGASAVEPYIEYTFDADGNITAAAMYGVTAIPARMFYGNTTLTNVDLTNSPNIESIGEYAFYNCSNLAITALPEAVTSIEDYAFYGCAKLALAKLPDNITNIGNYVFRGCSSLPLTALPVGVTNIGSNAFYGCSGLTFTSLPVGVGAIGTSAFNGCTKLALTSLPDVLESIGSSAFYNCTSLAISALPESIVSVGSYAFQGCTGLSYMEIKAAALGTGTKIFNGCTGLVAVWIRSTCATITATSAANAPFVACSTSLAIYAEASEKQSGWGTYFNRTGSSGTTSVSVAYNQTVCPW